MPGRGRMGWPGRDRSKHSGHYNTVQPVNQYALCLLVFLLSSCCFAFAQDELTAVPNRPTVATPTQPVQPAVLETQWCLDASGSEQDINGLLTIGGNKH